LGSDALDADVVRTLARVAGIDIPEEDLTSLSAALGKHLASIEALPTMDISDVEPPLVFRATWDE
jgi:Asp-tRNA(Asn)/Glu-tRNA(Gln) amidotransferase C subunit